MQGITAGLSLQHVEVICEDRYEVQSIGNSSGNQCEDEYEDSHFIRKDRAEIERRSSGDRREIEGKSKGDRREIEGRSKGDRREIEGRVGGAEAGAMRGARTGT